MGAIVDNQSGVVLALSSVVISALAIVFVCLTEIQMKNNLSGAASSPVFILYVVLLGVVLIHSVLGFNRGKNKRYKLSNHLWGGLSVIFLILTLGTAYQLLWDVPLILPRQVDLRRRELPSVLGDTTISWTYRSTKTWEPDVSSESESWNPWWSFFGESEGLKEYKTSAVNTWILPPFFRMSHIMWTPFGKEAKVLLPPLIDQLVVGLIFFVLCGMHFFSTRSASSTGVQVVSARRRTIKSYWKVLCSRQVAGPRMIRLISIIIISLSGMFVLMDHSSTEVIRYHILLCPEGGEDNPDGKCSDNSVNDNYFSRVRVFRDTADEWLMPYIKEIGLTAGNNLDLETNANRYLEELPSANQVNTIEVAGLNKISIEVEEQSILATDKKERTKFSLESLWVLSSVPGVLSLILTARISSLSACLLTLNKEMQGGLTSNVFIIMGILIDVSCGFLAWETFMSKMLGPMRSLLSNSEAVENGLPFTLNTLRNLRETFRSPISLKVSSFARLHSRAVAGFLHCVNRTAEMLSEGIDQTGVVAVPPTNTDVANHCSSTMSSVHWRSVAGSTLMISTLLPGILLVFLLLANIYLSKHRRIDASWKGLSHINNQCSPVPIQQQQQLPPRPELMSPELFHRNNLNILPYPAGQQMSLYNVPHQGNPAFFHRSSPGVNDVFMYEQDMNDMNQRQYSNMPNNNGGRAVMSPPSNPLMFANNGNIFARNALPRPLVRGYTPSLTPRSSNPAYNNGAPNGFAKGSE